MRKDKEKFRVFKDVFSESTMKTIYKLSSDGYIDYIIRPISTGKEANVFLGKDFDGESIAIKIYRIETSNFNNMWKYIYGDPRFDKVKKKKRDIIFAWAKKEFKNLEIAANSGVNVPHPITSRNNVLIMEFIGEDDNPAPTAKEFPPKNPKEWFNIIKSYIKHMYNANLVHGDISEYNILNFKETPFLIDFGQGVIREYPLAEELLKKDITNLIKWTKKLGVNAPSFEKVYKEIIKGDNRDG
jgi:RIO kinase 1